MNDQFTQLKAHKMQAWQNLTDEEIEKIKDVLNATGLGSVSTNDLNIIYRPNRLRKEELEQAFRVTLKPKVAKPYYRQHEKY
jgi:hypothetical protein